MDGRIGNGGGKGMLSRGNGPGGRAGAALAACLLAGNQTPRCFTNHDPAAILKSGKKFAALWTESVAAPPNVYSLSPAIKINGNWYAYTSNS